MVLIVFYGPIVLEKWSNILGGSCQKNWKDNVILEAQQVQAINTYTHTWHINTRQNQCYVKLFTLDHSFGFAFCFLGFFDSSPLPPLQKSLIELI